MKSEIKDKFIYGNIPTERDFHFLIDAMDSDIGKICKFPNQIIPSENWLLLSNTSLTASPGDSSLLFELFKYTTLSGDGVSFFELPALVPISNFSDYIFRGSRGRTVYAGNYPNTLSSCQGNFWYAGGSIQFASLSAAVHIEGIKNTDLQVSVTARHLNDYEKSLVPQGLTADNNFFPATLFEINVTNLSAMNDILLNGPVLAFKSENTTLIPCLLTTAFYTRLNDYIVDYYTNNFVLRVGGSRYKILTQYDFNLPLSATIPEGTPNRELMGYDVLYTETGFEMLEYNKNNKTYFVKLPTVINYEQGVTGFKVALLKQKPSYSFTNTLQTSSFARDISFTENCFKTCISGA